MSKFDLACIIDDDPIFIYGTKRLMQLTQFCDKFLVFHNGLDAIDYLRPVIINNQKKPEIILLDLNMPVMDGWQFLDELIQIPTDTLITVYIVSSSVDPADRNRAKLYENVTNYLIKPMTSERLKEILNEHQ